MEEDKEGILIVTGAIDSRSFPVPGAEGGREGRGEGGREGGSEE